MTVKLKAIKKLLKNAPLLIDYIDDESREHFEVVKELLTKSNIPFEIDPKLVRGLDYYTKTTFEIVSGKVGSQSALCGGGRYDLLIEQLGGKPTPGIGFAAGIERILLACENEKAFTTADEKVDLYIVRLDKDLASKVFELGLYFRNNNYSVEFDYLDRSVKAQMREANKLSARFVLFVGGEEYQSGKVNLKNMDSGEQQLIGIKEVSEISNILSK